ncbi:MAG: WD40 repeat domain-containing protein [Mariniblastus sp.]|nr:WD40 repeat domain-containing protein [Mariniblastus sp.]
MKNIELKPSLRCECIDEFVGDARLLLDRASFYSRRRSPLHIRSNYLRIIRSAAIFGTAILVLLAFGLTNPGSCCVQADLPKQQAESNDDSTDQQTPKAEAAFQTAEKIQARSDYHLAINHFMSSETNKAIDMLEGIPKKERDLEWYVTRRELDGGYMTLFGHTRGVRSVAFSPDGTQIVSGGYDNKVKLWNGCTGEEIDTLPEQSTYIMDIGFGSNQNTIIFADAMHANTAFDLSTAKVLWNKYNSSNGGFEIAISPTGDRIASTGMNEILLIDAKTGKTISKHRTSTSVKKMAFSPDGKRLAATFKSFDKGLTIWDTDTGKTIESLGGQAILAENIAFSPDGSMLATSDGGSEITVWSVANYSERWKTGGSSKINCVGFSPDGRFVVGGCNDGTLQFWDARSGEKRHTLRGHTGAVLDFDFHPDGTRIATGSSDGTVKVWDARLKSNHLRFEDNASAVTQVGFGINHDWLISTSRISSQSAQSSTPTVFIRNRYDGERLKSFEGIHFDLSPDGRFLAVSGWSSLTVWEIESEEKRWSIEQHHDQMNVAFRFSPDGRWLASTDRNNKIKILDALTGKESLELSGHESRCTCLCYSADGRYLVSGGYDDNAKLWNTNTGALVDTFDSRTMVESIAISPNGKLIASGTRGGLIRIWDIQLKEELSPLVGHSGTVNSIVFNPSSTRLVSGGGDGTVRIWDHNSGEQLRTLREHGGAVNSVAISPNGEFLASGNQGRSIVLWDARTVREEETIITSKFGWPEFVTFSDDFREIYSSFRDDSAREYLGWRFSTKEQYVLPQSIDREIAKNLSPDNRWLAVPRGRKVLLVDQKQKEDPVDKRIRLKKCQIDPDWHRKVGLECEKRELWFAAKFHWDRVLRDNPKDKSAYLALGRAMEGIPTPKKHWPENETTTEQEKFQSGKVSRISTGYFATPTKIPTDVFQRDITSIEVVLDDQDSGKNRSGLLVIDVPRVVFNEFGDVAGIESIKSFHHSVTLVPVDPQPGREGRMLGLQNRTVYKLDFDEPFCRRQLFLNLPNDNSQESKLLICLGKHQVVENVGQPPIEMMYLLHSKLNATPKIEGEEMLEKSATLSSGLIRKDGKWVASIEVTTNPAGRGSIKIDPNHVGISDFGDSFSQTLMGTFPSPVDLVDLKLPDPLKLGRRVFALKPIEPNASSMGQHGGDDIEYLLVVAAKKSGGHRLIVKTDRRIKHVFPLSDTGRKANKNDTK